MLNNEDSWPINHLPPHPAPTTTTTKIRIFVIQENALINVVCQNDGHFVQGEMS